MSSTSGSGTSSRALAALAALAALVLAAPAGAKVFYSRAEALAMAFPDAERVESETYVLGEEEVARIERLTGAPVDTKLVKVYRGMRGEQVLGYAVIDVHEVRTLPEAFMVVLSPAGEVRSLRVLAFYEPLDYLPADRWYEQFVEKDLGEPLRLGGDIHGVVGATLSASATTRGVRRILAYYQVLIQTKTGPGLSN